MHPVPTVTNTRSRALAVGAAGAVLLYFLFDFWLAGNSGGAGVANGLNDGLGSASQPSQSWANESPQPFVEPKMGERAELAQPEESRIQRQGQQQPSIEWSTIISSLKLRGAEELDAVEQKRMIRLFQSMVSADEDKMRLAKANLDSMSLESLLTEARSVLSWVQAQEGMKAIMSGQYGVYGRHEASRVTNEQLGERRITWTTVPLMRNGETLAVVIPLPIDRLPQLKAAQDYVEAIEQNLAKERAAKK